MTSTTLTQQQVDADPALRAALDKVKLGKHNGVSHQLTYTAYEILAKDLEGYGNTLGGTQQEALMELVGTMTKYAQGVKTGRRAFNLATGCGKTSALIAWITAAHRLGLEHVSIAVAASRVDALVNIKQALMERGVPESLIGLRYTDGIVAALPSTGAESRRYQLVTHSRVRSVRGDSRLFTHHGDTKRALMIYDETLWKADCVALGDEAVRMALGAYREKGINSMAGRERLIDYLTDCKTLIRDAIEKLQAIPEGERDPAGTMLLLPALTPVELDGYLVVLGSNPKWEPLRELLRLSPHELRVTITQQGGGLLWYSLRVPPELTDVLVLDASWPIRTLAKLDTSIICDSSYANVEVKSFGRLTVHQMLAFGGRHSVEQSFRRQERSKRDISKEVIEVIRSKPKQEGILIFTFKSRAWDNLDITKVLKEDMRDAGFDPDEKLDKKDRHGNALARFSFLTWGDETSRNDVSYCTTVIMAGLLHRSALDIASVIVGQAEDLKTGVTNRLITEMLNGELDHSAYQAMSRGSCRLVDNGVAHKMDCYVIHRDVKMRKRLAGVLSGAVWREWVPVHAKPDASGVTARAALRIVEALDKITTSVTKVSTSKFRADHGLGDIAPATFTKALTTALADSFEWLLQGRSLVRGLAS